VELFHASPELLGFNLELMVMKINLKTDGLDFFSSKSTTLSPFHVVGPCRMGLA